jgi:hypothetical protein
VGDVPGSQQHGDRPDGPKVAKDSDRRGVHPHDHSCKRWRAAMKNSAELTGIVFLFYGFFLIKPWAGFIVLGVSLVIFGTSLSDNQPAGDKSSVDHAGT